MQALQDIASEGNILVLLCLRDMLISAANFVGLSVCSSLITVGFSTGSSSSAVSSCWLSWPMAVVEVTGH